MLASFLLMVVKILADQPWYDVYGVVCAANGAQFFYKWVRLRQKPEFWLGLLWSAVAVVFAVCYVAAVL